MSHTATHLEPSEEATVKPLSLLAEWRKFRGSNGAHDSAEILAERVHGMDPVALAFMRHWKYTRLNPSRLTE